MRFVKVWTKKGGGEKKGWDERTWTAVDASAACCAATEPHNRMKAKPIMEFMMNSVEEFVSWRC